MFYTWSELFSTHLVYFIITYCNSKYLYVGFSYPFICMLATCLSSGEAAGSTSTNPCVIGCLLFLFLSITTATTIMMKTATLPIAIPTTFPVLYFDTAWTALKFCCWREQKTALECHPKKKHDALVPIQTSLHNSAVRSQFIWFCKLDRSRLIGLHECWSSSLRWALNLFCERTISDNESDFLFG